MGNFNSNNRSFRSRDDRRDGGRDNKSSFRRGGFSDRRDDGPKQMHTATCDSCGNTCEVPFKPTGNKPIYCSNCFEKSGNGSERRSNDRFNDRGDRGGRDNFRSDRSYDRPQSQSFSKPAVDYSAQLKEINAKLDQILSKLSEE